MDSLLPEERHATLIFDEMAIRPGLQYDHSICKVVGKATIPNSKGEMDGEIATHALVYMLAGVSTRWKQIVGYDLTSNSTHSEAVLNRIKSIIERANNIGITIRAIVSDMGPQNKSVWKLCNIVASRNSIIRNTIPHPCIEHEKLLIVPDPVHVFKNIAASLTSNRTFTFSDSFVKKYNLQSNFVSIQAVKEVFAIDKNDILKLCPRLKEKVIEPSHFEKMNVANAVALINNDISAAIYHYISMKNMDAKYSTTAWFFKNVYLWFKLLTSRFYSLSISTENKENYDSRLEHLQFIKEMFYNMYVDKVWKPFQTGVILATEGGIDFQKIYIEKYNYRYVMLGRLTQDCLENVFSMIRCRQKMPDAHMFKINLRLVCLSQFENNLTRGNYSEDTGTYIVKYSKELEEIKKKEIVETEIIENLQEEIEISFLDENNKVALYYLLGSIIHKVSSNLLTCEKCVMELIGPNDDIRLEKEINFILLKEYKEGSLIYPKFELFQFISYVEEQFRFDTNYIIANHIKMKDFVKRIMLYDQKPIISNCHQILNKIVTIFVRSRMHFELKNKNLVYKKNVIAHSSRSVAMRQALNEK